MRTGAPSEVERIREALSAMAHCSVHWLDHFVNQVLHAQVLDAVSGSERGGIAAQHE
ncbi:MAG: hypothetical protein ACHP83_19055 [Burkholderiales bacterium]